MSVRPIVLYASTPELLRQKSEPIQDELGDVRQLLADLEDTLLHHLNGVGLAAPQIGVLKRAIVVRLGGSREGNHGPPVPVINPIIVEAGRDLPDSDGCLSLPGLYAETVRPHFVRLRGIDEHGKTFEWMLEGFDAVVVHHELDHLDGILFIDRVASSDKLYTEAEARIRRVHERTSGSRT
jgi:peptide deformylase